MSWSPSLGRHSRRPRSPAMLRETVIKASGGGGGGMAEQQGTEVSRGEVGPVSFLWLHPLAGASGRSGTRHPWVQG